MFGSCSSQLSPRRRAAALGGAVAAIAGSSGLLRGHTGAGGWSDAVFGFVLGVSLVLALFVVVRSARASRG